MSECNSNFWFFTDVLTLWCPLAGGNAEHLLARDETAIPLSMKGY